MSQIVISVEDLCKTYHLGQIGTGTFSRDLEMWWAKRRGKPNPFLKIGQTDHGNQDDDTLWALKDINFTVQQGEVLGIIGRNGAGKSTLLKILSRVTAPTSGQVKVKGRIASLLEVGTGFHPELTGRENIYLNGAILGMTHQEVQRKFDEIVAFAEVEKFIDTPVKRYSSGMYVRLAFAVAAHLDPEILVIDEVLAVGDTEFQKKCLGKMGDVAKEGRTVLFVSHNMAAIQQLCPSSLLIRKGSMEKIGPSLDVINNYLDESGDSSQFVDLLKTQRPVKNKIVKFSSVQIVNKDLLATNGFMMGDDLVVRFQIKWLDQNFSQKIHIAIIIKTSDGIPIANCLNMDSGFKLENLSGTYEVNFKDNLLYPGQYHISLWAGLDRIETYDYVQNIISFNIIGGGLKTTRDLLRTDGIFYFTPSWKKID